MIPAGFILTGQRRANKQAHAPIILTGRIDDETQRFALPSEFFGIEEREADYPAFHNFNVWPATQAVLDALHDAAHLPGHNTIAEFSQWYDLARPQGRRMVICTGAEHALELAIRSAEQTQQAPPSAERQPVLIPAQR